MRSLEPDITVRPENDSGERQTIAADARSGSPERIEDTVLGCCGDLHQSAGRRNLETELLELLELLKI